MMASVLYSNEDILDFSSISTLVHGTIKPMPSERNAEPSTDSRSMIEENGEVASDTDKMTASFTNRSPSNVKLEKRSSMSQLLSQIKERLHGKRGKALKKQSRKDQAMFNGSEMLLWDNEGKWKERWFAFCANCLVLFKDSGCGSPDFALDVRKCKLEVLEENDEQGFLSFKLIEQNGKCQQFAAVTEGSYENLVTMLTRISRSSRASDCSISSAYSEPDSFSQFRFDDAIIPYSESEAFLESEAFVKKNRMSGKQADKQESIDSGTDGDISCLEGSDASIVGIEDYAAGWRNKDFRRRKTSSALQRPFIVQTDGTDENYVTHSGKIPKSNDQLPHRPLAHSESSPSSPRGFGPSYRQNLRSPDDRSVTKPIDYLNVDKADKKFARNRYSVPDFGLAKSSHNEEFHRQRLSCLEELLKLKEAHENNQYPEKSGKTKKKRATSLYVRDSKSDLFDENGNHRQTESLNRVPTGSPTSPNDLRMDQIVITKPLNGHSSQISVLSDSFNTSTSYNDESDLVDEFNEDNLRKQTLLMKRRNSLRLQKQVVNEKVQALRERVNQSNGTSKDPESAEEEENLTKLEEKLSNIDKELNEINQNVAVPADDFKEGKRKKQQIFSKFKSSQKATTPVGNRKTNTPKETVTNSENTMMNISISPSVRKQSFTRSIFRHPSTKRDSGGSFMSLNTANAATIDIVPDSNANSKETDGKNYDLKNNYDKKMDLQRSRKASRASSVQESDDVDGKRASEKDLNREALLKIEDFEQFAVEITAKRVADCINV